MHKNYQLTLFLVLIMKSQTSSPDWPNQALVGPKREKTWFLRAGSGMT